MSGQYPQTFYRVSAKALIKDTTGKLLVVKEKSDNWELPGGGIDHGEMPHETLARELAEEIGLTGAFTERLLTTEIFWLEHKQAWLLWLVYAVEVEGQVMINVHDANDAMFIGPHKFKTSESLVEQAIYRVSLLA